MGALIASLAQRAWRLLASAALALACAGAATTFAASLTVLVDTDNNAASGCTVATPGGPFDGVERRFVTTVDTTQNPPRVTGITQEDCTAAPGTFGAPVVVSAGGWAVGVGNGTSGYNVIETGLPLSTNPSVVRIAVVYTDPAIGTDAVITAPGGGPIFVVASHISGHEQIPTLSDAMLFLLVLLVAAVGWRYGRHKFPAAPMAIIALVMVTTLAYAAIVLDGLIGDWAGIPPVATDAVDAPIGVDISAVFATIEGTTLFVRVDALTGMPPAAVADNYTAVAGTTLNIASGSGLLANDTRGAPLATVTSFGGGSLGGTVTTNAAGSTATFGTGGSLTVNGDGTFSFTPATGFTGSFTFSYRLGNINGTSDAVVTIATQQAPAFTSANATTFNVGTAGTFTVTASGVPAPTLSMTGALPAGVTFNAGTGVLSGTPAAGTAGTYPLIFTAANGVAPNATQNFTLTVTQGVAITSANATTFTVGTAGTFTVTTSSSPVAATITQTGALPAGVTFTNNGNGTATLAGTPGPGTGGSYPLTITAGNGNPPDGTQNFTLTVNQAPAITSGNAATFTVGIAGTFTVTTTGFPTGASMAIGAAGALPAGVTFVNNGNGTATLAGTPTAGGTFPLTITANNGVAPNATQPFTLTVNQAPAITSAAAVTFQTGVLGTFTVTTTGVPIAGTITATGALPTGVTFVNNGNGTATLSGTPIAGTGGTYPLTITANNGVLPNATQNFVLTVNQPPAITSANAATFTVNVLGPAFTVTTTGFPTGAAMAISEAGALPTGVTFTNNGNGTATLTGTPGAGTAGTYPITITANNAVPPNATQPFTITVIDSAVGVDDGYPVVHDTPLSVLAASGLLANDTGTAPLAVTSVTGTGVPCTVFPCVAIATTNGSVSVNADGSFTYTPATDFAGADTFTYVVTNVAGSDTATVTITVTNALPVVDLNGPAAVIDFAPTFTEGGGPVAIVDAAQLTVADTDDTQLTGATIVITNPLDGLSESLAITCPDAGPGCSGAILAANVVYTPATHTLEILATAPLADYQALLRTLTYSNISVPPNATARDVTVTVNDGIADNLPLAHATITIAGVNSAPTITAPATATTPVNTARVFAGTVSVADPDAGTANVQVTLTVTNGTATLSGTAGLTVLGNGTASVTSTGSIASQNAALNNMSFTPTTGYSGPASLQIDIDDLGNTGAGGPLTDTHTINITVDNLPAVTTTIPTNGATLVSTTSTITVNFNENVTVTGASFTINCSVSAARAFTPAGTGTSSIILTPNVALPAGETCTVTVVAAQVTDSIAQNMAANYVFSFTTNTLPTVTSTVPTNGATGVLPASDITVNFSENVNAPAGAFTISCGISGAHAFAHSPGPASVVLNPTVDFTTGETCTVTVLAAQVTDTDAGQNMAANYVLTFTVAQPPAITSGAATTFVVGSAGTFTVTTTGSPTGVSMVISQTGALPTGVTFTNNNDGTATLAGTPAAGMGGTYPITITANNGVAPNATQNFTLTVNQAPAFTSANATTFTTGVAGNFTLTASGFPTTFTFTLSIGSLPAGVTLTPAGVLSGTPNAGTGGTYPVTFTVSNGVAPAGTQNFTLTVNQPPAITSANTVTFTVGAPGSFIVVTTGFPVPGVSQSGMLPTGITFTPATNTLGGTPTQSGTFPLVFTASNAVPPNATQNFTLLVCPVITATPASITQPTRTNAYSVSLGGSGGTGPYTFAVTGGALPAGLSMSGAGAITGTVTGSGAFSFTVTVTDTATGCTGTTTYSGTINEPPTAGTDAYETVGNTQLEVANPGVVTTPKILVTASNLLSNDNNGDGGGNGVGVTVVAGTFATTNGSVTFAANGTFTYLPNAGFTGLDSFSYTVSDGIGTATGTVNITVVTHRVWYVKNDAAAGGDGRSTQPFDTLVEATTAANTVNDTIFVYRGNGATTGQNAGAPLDNSQRLIGEGVALDVPVTVNGVVSPVLTAAGSRPVIGNSGGNGVTLALNNTVKGLDIANSTGFAIQGASVGALTVNNMAINTTGGGLDLTGAPSTVSVVLDSITSSGGSKNVNLVGLGGTVTLGSGALSGSTSHAFDVSGGTANVTFTGTIANAATNARVVSVASKTAGTVALSGAITSSGTNPAGVVLTGNTGATINFTGGLNLSTGTNAAFTATGGGTVNATQDNVTIVNTAATTSGTAVNLTGVGGAVTFRSVNVSSGGANGIFLQNTTGSFTVTGNSGGNCGGVVTNNNTVPTAPATGDCTGGTIQNAATGIRLDNVQNVSLTRMRVNGTSADNFGIFGTNVNGFTLARSVIDGAIGATSGAGDAPLAFGITNPGGTNGLNGTNSITDSTISGGIEHNLEVYNQSGTFTLNITRTVIQSNSVALGSDGFLIETQGTADGTVVIDNSHFNDNKSQANQANALDSSTLDITVQNSWIRRSTQGNEGLVYQNAANGDLIVHVTNNRFTGILGSNIFVGNTAGNASASSSLSAVVSGNTMTVGASGGPYPTNRTLLAFPSSTNGSIAPSNILFDSNTIHTFSDPLSGIAEPIFVSTPDANTDPSFTATVTNNVVNITDPAGTSLRGIAIQSTQTVSAGCFDVRNNDVNYIPSAPAGVNGIRVRQAGSGTVQLEQGGSAGGAGVVLAANNPLATTEVVGVVTVVGNATCQVPPT